MILLAGPWIGEFGWELFCWQGYIRSISEKFDKTIVVGRPGHKILYEDFCDEYIEFDPESFKTNGWRCETTKKFKFYKIKHDKYVSGDFDIGFQYNGINFGLSDKFKSQKFFKYKSNSDVHFDILIHPRNKITGSERNWYKDSWIELVKLLKDYKIGVIGNSESFDIKHNTIDLRNIDLKNLIGIINNSKLVVGPSSGPMHLASLCNKKHLVWSSNFNKLRYEKLWNPFNTEVVFYDKEDWNPSFKNIYKLIVENMGDK